MPKYLESDSEDFEEESDGGQDAASCASPSEDDRSEDDAPAKGKKRAANKGAKEASPAKKAKSQASTAPAKKAAASKKPGGGTGEGGNGGAPKAKAAKAPSPAKAVKASGPAAVKAKDGGGGNSAAAAPAPAPLQKKTPRVAILDYMRTVNRPYSTLNMFDNLKKAIPRAAIQKVVDGLVTDGNLSVQEFGKTKIYYFSQDRLAKDLGEITPAKLAGLAREAKALKEEFESVSAELRTAKAHVAKLTAEPTDDALVVEIARLEQQNAALTAKNEATSAGMKDMDPQAMVKAKANYNKMRSVWVSRKRTCKGVIDMICEGMDKKPKVVQDLMGVEDDDQPIPDKMA